MYDNDDVSFARSQILVASREEMEGNKSEIKASCNKPATTRPTTISMTVVYEDDKMTIDSDMTLETSPGPSAKPRKAAMKTHQVSEWKGKCDKPVKKRLLR